MPEQEPQLPLLAPAGGRGEGGADRGGRAPLQDQNVRKAQEGQLLLRRQVSQQQLVAGATCNGYRSSGSIDYTVGRICLTRGSSRSNIGLLLRML